MTVILKETHEKILRKLRRKHLWIQIIELIFFSILMTSSLGFNWFAEIERKIVNESYGILKTNAKEMQARIKLLEILRSKPLTVGQALAVADVLIDETKRKNVKAPLILAVIEQESEFKSIATSNKGARGVMQIMPETWKLYGPQGEFGKAANNIYDPAQNMRVGISYLNDLLNEHKNLEKALSTYYSGQSNFEGSRTYIRQVMAKAKQFESDLEK